jgi:hypothetical protein
MENSFLWMDSIDERFKSFLTEDAQVLVTDYKSEEGVPFEEIMKMTMHIP